LRPDELEQGKSNMPAFERTWTAERIELLKNCFEAGLTCRQIAAQIGVSRNAVIGKISRLKLTRDTDGETPARRAPRGPAKGRSLRATPRQQYELLQAVYEDAAPAEPIPGEHACSLLELDEERCRWPFSSPGAEDFRFCGNRSIHGLPYCAGHARLAYQPGSSRRAARG
jgi:GcrA cell cycle regulator